MCAVRTSGLKMFHNWEFVNSKTLITTRRQASGMSECCCCCGNLHDDDFMTLNVEREECVVVDGKGNGNREDLLMEERETKIY